MVDENYEELDIQITPLAQPQITEYLPQSEQRGISTPLIFNTEDKTVDIIPTTTPYSLANRYIPKRLQFKVIEWATNCAVGDGKYYIHIDDSLNGMNLVYCHARVVTAGTTGTMDIQLYNLTDSQDMLSTKLTIDSGETGSNTAATPYVINTSYDDVATNDVLRIDIDAVHTTPAQGLIVTLGFATT